jgi:copper chaperone CopZ
MVATRSAFLINKVLMQSPTGIDSRRAVRESYRRAERTAAPGTIDRSTQMAGANQTVTLNAPDIHCGHCVAKVQRAVGGLVGVDSVSASPATKQVTVSFDPACVSVDDIAARLKDEGYPISEKPARVSTLPLAQ